MKNILLSAAITCSFAATANSPYIADVLDFCPAPGQFINETPEYETGDTKAAILEKCRQYLVGQQRGSIISLGAYGGYIIFRFDHPVANKPGEYDFKIYGNAFKNYSSDNAGNSEPGIVMVSRDVNKNGIPDDEWYELAGSEYHKSSTRHNYEITYYKPSGNEPDATYIRWTSNDPDEPSGYVMRNKFHSQSYWPLWIEDSQLKFSGTRVAKNAFQENGTWLLRFLDWGYADNLPASSDPGFKIDWAVDAQGNQVKLPKIDFIKVYTAINQYCGDLGETSTEILGAEDLHPGYVSVESVAGPAGFTLLGCVDGQLLIENEQNNTRAEIYDLQGRMLKTINLVSGYNSCDISELDAGVYIVRSNSRSLKFIR